MNDFRPALSLDAGAERIDGKRGALSAETKLRISLAALSRGADVEAIARQYRVSLEDVAHWRALTSDAALLALRSDETSGRDIRSQLVDAEMRELQREVRRHRLANAMLTDALTSTKESFRKFTGVDIDDPAGVAELERTLAFSEPPQSDAVASE